MSAVTSPLATLLAEQPAPRRITPARVIMGLVGVFVLWAAVAPLDEVAVAPAEIVPHEQIQTIQHLEGGMIEKIHVFEGDHVTKDQPLVQLTVTPFVTNREGLKLDMEGMQLKKARLEAEAAGKPSFELPAGQSASPEMVQREQQAFAGRRLKMDSALAQLKEQVQQRDLDVRQLHTEKASIVGNLGVLQEKLAISSGLVKDKLTSRLDHLQLQSEVKELQGRLEVIQVAIPRAEAALAEAKEKTNSVDLEFRNQAQEELTQLSVDLAKTKELLARASDQVTRTTIKSPVDGVVKSLKTHTVGGVLQPGEAMMEIVPTSDNLIVEAKLDPRDIGFVKPGQKALLKLLTYDYARYGGVEADVVSVSADSHVDQRSGASYFRVLARTKRNFLGGKPGEYPITVGMQSTLEIHTGKRTVLAYLLKPVMAVKHEAFKER